MPPIYVWRSLETDKKVEVLRSFKDYQVPPTEEEKDGDPTPDDKWTRVIHTFTLQHPPGYGKKGSW